MTKINYPPRVSLRIDVPTPIERLSRLFPDREVYCKREDLTGTLLTGNKVRKLEFCLHESLEQNADTLITVGGIQSNHARCTAGVAAMLGMKSVLLLREGENQEKPEGNYLLDRLLGSEIHWISRKEYKNHTFHLSRLAQQLTQQGHRPYIVSEGGSSALGALGYVVVMEELMQQAEPFDYIVTAVGSGGTFAGLYAGAKLFSPKTQVVGINVYLDATYFQNRCFQLLCEMGAKYHTPVPDRSQALDIRDQFVGPGYAQVGPSEKACIRRVASQSGLFLDPVYTSKAFLGMEALLQEIPPQKRVLFIHTGGIFGLMVSHLDYFSS